MRWSKGELEIYQARRGVEVVRDEKGEPVRLLLGARKPSVNAGAAELFIPGLRLVSESNERSHWAVRAKRFKEQKEAVWYAWKQQPLKVPNGPMTITITRVGPKKLDTDNLAGSAKGLRDALAAIVGVDDGSDRIEWHYEQEAVGKRKYAVRIRIEARAEA